MKIIYSDVFVSDLDESMNGLLCKSASNGITFTVTGKNISLPECATNKTEIIENLIITEIERESSFINIYGYSDSEALIIIRAQILLLNSHSENWKNLTLESGLEMSPSFETSIEGVLAYNSENVSDTGWLSSIINRYLIASENSILCRA